MSTRALQTCPQVLLELKNTHILVKEVIILMWDDSAANDDYVFGVPLLKFSH